MTKALTTQFPNDSIATAMYFMSHALHRCPHIFDLDDHFHLQFKIMLSICIDTRKKQKSFCELRRNNNPVEREVPLEENEGFCHYKEQLVLGCIRHL